MLTSPSVQTHTYKDLFGNTCRRLIAPGGSFRILYDAVVSDNGLYAGGKAASVSLAFACGLLDCSVVEVDSTVQLSRAGK